MKQKKNAKTHAGIVGYGTYIPQYRIRTVDIARVWKKKEEDIIHYTGEERSA